MKHSKLIGFQTPVERIARVAGAAYDAATAPQTAPSGSISIDNADGTHTIIGPQAGSGEGAPSGQSIATHVGDTTPPPVPAGIEAWSGDGSLHVSWDGTLSGYVPADFDHISILIDGEEVAQLSSAGSVTVGGVEAGSAVSVTATAEDDACLADGTPVHNVSVPCAAVSVEIRDVAEEVKEKTDAHSGQIDAIQKDIEAYKKSATATYATKTEVDSKTGAITKTLAADYTKTADLASTEAVRDAKAAGTAAQASIDGMKIGGRNLALNSAKLDIAADIDNRYVASYLAGLPIVERADGMREVRVTSKWQGIGVFANALDLNAGDEVVFSAFAHAFGADSNLSFWAMCVDASGARVYKKLYIDGASYLGDSKSLGTIEAGSTRRLAVKIKWTDEAKSLIDGGGYIRLTFQVSSQVASGNYVSFYAPKLERGNKATDWTPAPEDTDSAVADAKKAGTDAGSALDSYKGVVSQTYAEKTELTEAVNQLSSTMSSNYTAFIDYRQSNDTALSKAQSDAMNAQSTIDSYKTANDKAVADAKAAGTTAQNQLSSYKSSNDAAVKDAKKAGTDAQADLNSYKDTTDQRLDELKNIADNAIETYYLKGTPTASNPPASTWTTDALKKKHAGDLYMDTDTGYSYRWSGTEWVQVKDSDVTKALKEIESVKTTYATKSELKATDTELSGKISDTLTTARSYTDSSMEQEVTARNAAIKAQADSISLDVSRTYTRSDTFSAYQEDADGRIATANSNASTAVSTAKTAASDAATAKTNASSAVSTANSAKSTAQTASTNASNAVSTANSANSKSDSAVSTANSAKSAASTATSTADTAKSTADAAKSTADDAYSRTLRVQISSSPEDATGDTSALTATVWRGGQQLTEQEVAMMGLIKWYVGDSCVATGYTYTCAAGTAVECRLEG